MSVPSVNEANLNSRAGSSKRFTGTVPVGLVVVEFVLDGIIAEPQGSRPTSGNVRAQGFPKELLLNGNRACPVGDEKNVNQDLDAMAKAGKPGGLSERMRKRVAWKQRLGASNGAGAGKEKRRVRNGDRQSLGQGRCSEMPTLQAALGSVQLVKGIALSSSL